MDSILTVFLTGLVISFIVYFVIKAFQDRGKKMGQKGEDTTDITIEL